MLNAWEDPGQRLWPDRGQAESSAGFPVRAAFSIVWDGPANLRIYARDAARHMRGVADPNLSLMAWRSAMIANSLLGKTAYEVEGESSALDFQETR